jgi:hypothetical protein
MSSAFGLYGVKMLIERGYTRRHPHATFKVLGCHLCLGCHTHQLCGYKGTCSSNPGPVSGVSPQLEFDGGSNAIETCQQRGAEVFGGRQLQLMHVRTRSLMFRRVGGVAL